MASTELALLFPMIMLMVLALVHVTLQSHASSVLQAAVDHAAEVGSSYDATVADVEAAGRAFVASSQLVVDPTVSALFESPEWVRVSITASYPSVLGSRSISAAALVPRERDRP